MVRKKVTSTFNAQAGWVYQEWLLSRQILAFADFGLFVQCETGNPKSLAGDDVKFIRDDEHGDEWDTAEKPDKSFKSSGDESRKAGANDDNETLRYAYICGSWFPEVRELLWEQVEPGPRIRVQGVPTWSWASMGTTITNATGGNVISDLEVRWSTPYRSSSDCVLKDFIHVPVDPGTLRPRFDLAGEYTPDNIYGNDGRFAALGVSGRLMEIQLHDLFTDDDDRTVAANITSQRPSFGCEMWRGVTTPETPGTIAGWASIEHPDFQTDVSCECDEAIFALIATVSRKVQGGWLLGNFSPHLTAYEVLYLRRVHIPGFETRDRDCYERIGVGRLFGDEMGITYAVTDESTVWLV
ncbi:hypothetical protein GQX73_g1212 [Xylaria multiplex]|uniref:Heterokaryon incompatibility domain-containing protein n=1 Tax=Xylaria multiplex TaxID=323545 RepID=A0A7C8NAQ0_9PEZI|nr:hypothetical protein GQX73_g1212 [Xylaria multiplex]